MWRPLQDGQTPRPLQENGLEPPDQAAADPLGERGQIGLVDRAGGQERRRRPASML
jgi:hypothetical protein